MRERFYILECRSNEPEFGYNKHTNMTSSSEEEQRARRREWERQYKGVKNPHKKIRCIETGEVFETLTAASKSVNRSIEAIRKSIASGHKCAGYHWERLEP